MVGEGEKRNWCVPAGSRCNSIRAVMEALITPSPSFFSLLTLILQPGQASSIGRECSLREEFSARGSSVTCQWPSTIFNPKHKISALRFYLIRIDH